MILRCFGGVRAKPERRQSNAKSVLIWPLADGVCDQDRPDMGVSSHRRDLPVPGRHVTDHQMRLYRSSDCQTRHTAGCGGQSIAQHGEGLQDREIPKVASSVENGSRPTAP
jgi:hypothetical protein